MCKECPFAKTSAPGWLGGLWTAPQLHGLIMSEREFPCHLTIGKRKGGRCRGSVVYMAKAFKSPHDLVLKQQVESATGEEMDAVLDVPGFMEHHKGAEVVGVAIF